MEMNFSQISMAFRCNSTNEYSTLLFFFHSSRLSVEKHTVNCPYKAMFIQCLLWHTLKMIMSDWLFSLVNLLVWHVLNLVNLVQLNCSEWDHWYIPSGMMDVFLDRRLMRDDNRGVGQGVMDNREIFSHFKLLFEPRRTVCSSSSTSLVLPTFSFL